MSTEPSPVLDTGIVRELIGAVADSDTSFMTDLMRAFVKDAGAALERMRRHAFFGDAEALRREAHRLKGASATVGAVRLAAACLALERSGKSGICTGADAQVEQALAILDATRVGISQFFRGTIAKAA